MIQELSRLRVADNSGAKEIMCFRVMGGTGKGSTGKRYAKVGDIIVASVKFAIPNGLLKKGQVVKAVIVRTVGKHRREDGSYVSFDDNAAVLLNKEGQPIGTRIFGPVAREIIAKNAENKKIASLAPEVV